ncbi:hypothetical protein Tco_0975292 [Tanacetum coccineum]|uniref:Uncharacterized protein n=1 Tax=Tanacetum coccineum TaxID=301880 RepID=A0ABQ5EDZ1_9ASTR
MFQLRQLLNSKGSHTLPNCLLKLKIPFPEMAGYSQKWHNGTSSRTRSTKTSDGLAAIQVQLNNLGREIKKVNKKVYAAQVGCELCKGPHYTKDYPQKEERKVLEEAYYTQFGAPYQPGGQYRAAGPGFYQQNNGNPSDNDEGKSHDGTLIDIPVFVGSFSIILGFTIIEDDDMTRGIVLGMKFCKKYANNTAYPRVWDTAY